MTTELLTFSLCLWKRIYFAKSIFWKNAVYIITFLVKVCLVLHVVLWAKILVNRVGILSPVWQRWIIFFRCKKNIFFLKNNNWICHGNFFVYTPLHLFTSALLFKLCVPQGYTQIFKRIGKIQFASELTILLNL